MNPDRKDQLNSSSNAEATFVQSTRTQRFLKKSKTCHVCIHWIALTQYFQMRTHVPGFQCFFLLGFLHPFDLAILATSSKRVYALFGVNKSRARNLMKKEDMRQ